MYRTSAELYEKYLAAYPNSKRVLRVLRLLRRRPLLLGPVPQAIAAYQNVRDSLMDNRYQEDAAFRMIKAYEEIIERHEARGKDSGPAHPRREEHQGAR